MINSEVYRRVALRAKCENGHALSPDEIAAKSANADTCGDDSSSSRSRSRVRKTNILLFAAFLFTGGAALFDSLAGAENNGGGNGGKDDTKRQFRTDTKAAETAATVAIAGANRLLEEKEENVGDDGSRNGTKRTFHTETRISGIAAMAPIVAVDRVPAEAGTNGGDDNNKNGMKQQFRTVTTTAGPEAKTESASVDRVTVVEAENNGDDDHKNGTERRFQTATMAAETALTAETAGVGRVPDCLARPGPSVVILMSLGRSGSTVIWQVLTELSNSTPMFRVPEYVGSNPDSIMKFFDLDLMVEKKLTGLKGRKRMIRHVPAKGGWKIHGEWLVEYACFLREMSQNQTSQEERREDAFVGFKWKPYLETFNEREEARETLQRIASMAKAGEKPPVRILRSRRNPLDVSLSRLKNEERRSKSKRLRGHCDKGNEKCLKRLSVGKRHVEDVEGLYKSALQTWADENAVDDVLRRAKVPVEFLSYDELFYPDGIVDGEKEWDRALRFVMDERVAGASVSWTDVQKSILHASTTPSRCHKALIENWEDVYRAFNGTAIQHLFRLC